MKRGFLIFVALSASCALVRAQAPAGSSPAFDVASVKQNKSGENGGRFGGPPSRWTAINVPLRQFILFAYQVQPFQLEGAPAWIATDRWDISAKTERRFPPQPGVTPGPTAVMLKALLADRFKLVVHIETRQAPIYALVLARADEAPGPELHRSDVDCAALLAASLRGQAPPQPPPGKMLCGIMTDTGRISGGAQPMSRLAAQISQQVQRVVVDRTGLTGVYDFILTYAPDRVPRAEAGGPDPAPVDPNLPSLFTALQEQLGLKLESTRGPIDVLVIDRVERPTDD